jgi:hypothetical protein
MNEQRVARHLLMPFYHVAAHAAKKFGRYANIGGY